MHKRTDRIAEGALVSEVKTRICNLWLQRGGDDLKKRNYLLYLPTMRCSFLCSVDPSFLSISLISIAVVCTVLILHTVCPRSQLLFSEHTVKNGQDFLDMQYAIMNIYL